MQEYHYEEVTIDPIRLTSVKSSYKVEDDNYIIHSVLVRVKTSRAEGPISQLQQIGSKANLNLSKTDPDRRLFETQKMNVTTKRGTYHINQPIFTNIKCLGAVGEITVRKTQAIGHSQSVMRIQQPPLRNSD